MFQKKAIKDFIKDLAGAGPAPGGGSAAALAGAVGAGLALMAMNITLIKAGDRKIKSKLLKARRRVKSIAGRFLRLMDEDAAAFLKVVEALKLPKITDSQKIKRSKAIQTGYKTAALVPLKTTALALELKTIINKIENLLVKSVASDMKVAEFLIEATFNGAIVNVEVNLDSIGDKNFKKRLGAKIRKYERRFINRCSCQ